jgi:hypothetical protein
VRFLARHPENLQNQGTYGMHRGKIARFALAMKAEGMPLPNPVVDGANDFRALCRIQQWMEQMIFAHFAADSPALRF